MWYTEEKEEEGTQWKNMTITPLPLPMPESCS